MGKTAKLNIVAPGREKLTEEVISLSTSESNGNIEFLGRKDFQVKIRGHRIELGEIEAAMNKYPGVKKSVAAAVGDVQGNKYLAGYIIPETGTRKVFLMSIKCRILI